MVCQDILEVLLVKIVREAAVSMRIVQPPSKSKECAAAKRYIDENFSENITLDKLAEITHVNIPTLSSGSTTPRPSTTCSTAALPKARPC